MHYRGSRSGAPSGWLRNSKGSVRAAARAVVETLERRQLLAAGDPIINEFLADNAGGIRDMDGERNDWIEIYNPGSQSVNLQGWKLQDSGETWTFPSVTLPASGRLLVFASNKNRAISGQELHTNFRLAREGEYLALIKPDGATKTSEFNPYPEQVTDVSYGVGSTATDVQIMVGSGAAARTLVPQDNSLGLNWNGSISSFDDSGWIAGPTGVGYEAQPGSGTSYSSLLGTDVRAQMEGQSTSAYIRIPFVAENLPNITKLTLRMKYDDGFVAYINGEHVAMRNLFGSTISNTSRAAGDRGDSLALQFEDVDLTPFISALQDEVNVLAMHGLNNSAGSSDFLVLPELHAEMAETGGEASFRYMAEPSPGAANQPGGEGVVQDTSFSVDRGFYDDPFQLEITTETSGAEIRYTLDGSVPTPTNGFVYSGPISIGPQLYGITGGPAKPGVITVRAAAFKPGWNPTNIDAQTYVFLDHVITQDGSNLPNTWGNNSIPDYAMDPRVVNPNIDTIRNDLKSLPTVNLSMPLDDWFGANGVGIYPSGIGVPKAVSMEYFTADGAEGFQIDGGVQIIGGGEGGTSAHRWKTYKLSMRIKFQEIYGDSELAYALFGPDAAHEFDTLVFDSQINKTWLHPDAGQRAAAMLIQDQYISDLQNAMSGAPGHGPQGKFVHLYLNGIYWGVYDLHERPDEHFAEEYFGGNDEDWDVLSHSASNPSNGGAIAVANFSDLLSRVRADVTNPVNYARVEEELDIDDFIDYMLANFYGGNHDWSHKNWYATHNRVDPNGKWRFHSWDAEHVFHTGFGGTIDPFVDSTGDNDRNSPTEIHQFLTASPEYRTRFADRVQKHFFDGGVLTPERTAAMYQARMAEVYDAMVAESARWGDNRRPSQPYTREDWLAHQQRLLTEYFPIRSGIVLDQLRARGLFPSVGAPSFSPDGGTFDDPVVLQITKPGAGQIYYTTDGSDPRLPGGGVNPGAAIYTSGIDLNDSAMVRARVLSGGTWSALTEAPFIIGPPPALRVTEIMYNPAPPAPNSLTPPDDYEFIELQNTGSSPIDLSGFGFRRGIDSTFANGTILQPGQRTVLVKNPAAFAERYPAVAIGGTYTGSLSNAGERLTLTTQLGQVIQNFEYSDGWYPQTDGEGFSLIAVNPNATNAELSTKDGWRPSQPLHGGPGVADPGPMPGIVVVNEVNTNTVGAADWIELHNTTGSAIDIGGWFLSDNDNNLKKYRIATGTIVPANGYLVFHESTHFGVAGNLGVNAPFALDSSGEAMYLTSADAAGTLLGYRDDVDFGAAPEGVAFGRHVKSTGETDFWAMSTPTPDAANAAPRVGPVVINEIMYSPAPGGDEYIELRNITGSSVNLFDPANPTNTWHFTDGVTFAFPQGASLAAGAYALVVDIDPATFRTKYGIPQSVQIFGPWTGNLNNAGEKLELSMPGQPETGGDVPSIAVDRINYDDESPWPLSPNGTGPSLARNSATGYANDVANWAPSLLNGGTPGASNGDDDSDPPIADIVDVAPVLRNSPVDTITIVFSEPVVDFTLADLSLTRGGGANLLTGAQTLTSADNITWTLGNLTGLTGTIGSYLLTLTASGIHDAAGNAVAANATNAWAVDTTAPAADIVDVSPDPRNTSVNAITIVFTEPVANFDKNDLTLTRAGGENLIAAHHTLTTSDGGRTWLLGNLDAQTAASGSYALTLNAAGSGITDIAGNPLAGDATDAFVVSTASPIAVTGTAGDDVYYVARQGTHVMVFANGSGAGSPLHNVPFDSVSSISIETLDGNDTVILDFGDGATVPAGGLTVNGGDGAADAVRIVDAASAINVGATSATVASAAFAHDGVELIEVPATATALDLADGTNAKVGGQGGIMTVSAITLGTGSKLDLGDNELRVTGGDVAAIEALVASARNGSASRWQGAGIGTSAAGSLTGLAVGESAGAVVVKLTYNGDANLDGAVNADDYFRIDSNFIAQPANPLYAQGDFNFDDQINADDYFLIDSAFIGQGAALSGASQPTAAATSPTAATAAAQITPVVWDDDAEKKKVRKTRVDSLFSERRIPSRPSRPSARR